jgi:Domain of unknown function (DUF4281)
LVDVLFALVSVVVLPFWLLMLVAPAWSVTRAVIGSPWIVAVPVLVYLGLVVTDLGGFVQAFSRPALDGVVALLGTARGATLAWAHLLAFDLFTGRWIYLDARDRGLPRWVTAPALVLTFLAGPVGLLLHLLTRGLGADPPRP